jgi:hypothetical protein
MDTVCELELNRLSAGHDAKGKGKRKGTGTGPREPSMIGT